MSLQNLPLELVSLIVDEFQADKQSLKTISLVSRLFLDACRTHLFTVFRLNSLNPAFDYKCTAWDSLIRHSTALLPYIRVLELGPPIFRLSSRNTAAWSDHWNNVLSRRLPSIHNERVELIAAGAVNVKVVILRFEYQSWGNFSPSFRRVVLNLLKRESVSSLSIEDVIDFPMQELRECIRLRDLSLISVVAAQQPNAYSQVEAGRRERDPKGHLNSFTAIASDQCIDPLVDVLSSPSSSLDLSHLQRLSVNATGTDGRSAMSKLPAHSRSITMLELRLNNGKDYDICDLQNFPNLHALFISVSYSPLRRPILPLARFLSRSGKACNLEELKIFFRKDSDAEFEPESSSQSLTRICTSRDWRELEQRLTVQTQFPRLKKMSLVFRPKDMTIFLNEYLTMSLHLCLVQAMPALYALTNPTVEVYDDRFEQYIQD